MYKVVEGKVEVAHVRMALRTVTAFDADSRAKTFDDAMQTSSDKSREIQNRNRDGLDKAQELALALEAKHWSSATSCALQLRQATAVGA